MNRNGEGGAAVGHLLAIGGDAHDAKRVKRGEASQLGHGIQPQDGINIMNGVGTHDFQVIGNACRLVSKFISLQLINNLEFNSSFIYRWSPNSIRDAINME